MYRENISNFVKEDRVKLLIPKNRGLNTYVRSLLPQIGVVTGENMEGLERIAKDDAAISSLEIDDIIMERTGQKTFQIDFVRGGDIPQLVEDFMGQGETVYGLTGDDLFDEYLMKMSWNNQRSGLKVLNTYDWFDEAAMYKRPALCLMARTSSISDLPEKPKLAMNSKYWFISNEYIEKAMYALGKKPAIKTYSGGTEETITDGINDCCIDIVYSGKSLRENGLNVLDIVRFSDIVLIGQDPNDMGNAFCEDYRQVMERKLNPKEDSLTTKLLNDGKERRNKIGVEMMELFSAIESGKNIPGEITDVMYALNLLMVAEGISPREIASALYRR
ncbi:hypothetical protein COV19_00960 [Candidatus Woesearchaeota archaeon CG10_big_fil_rev_8_21_14_0_10_44_13]|nr:MAG: hypothetical protein COV19_00960 [Candidatus Woesearchaeota archaeon CG10_big_fil_rev_8_21_14_0_10_44_13]